MKMAENACTGRAPQIHPQIDSFRFVERLERGFRALCELHHFRERRWVEPGKLSRVVVRNDNEMAAGVRKTIQDYKRAYPAMNDQSRCVVCALRGVAEDTFRLFACDRTPDVLVAPRCPEIVHFFRGFVSTKPRTPSVCASPEFRTASISQNKTPAIAGVHETGIFRPD